MHYRTMLAAILTLAMSIVYADDGLVSVRSDYDVETTIDRLEKALVSKGMTIFTRISHTEGARKAGLDLGPTELLVFGNPGIGTLLMQCSRTSAIDLPLKALAYEDGYGQVWLVYNDPAYLAVRHRATGCESVVDRMSRALKQFTGAAANR